MSRPTPHPAAAILLILLLSATTTASADNQQELLLQSAHRQVGITVIYDGSYVRLDYPNGDIPIERGVCTDVIVRAYRGIGIDLQQRVHEDMRDAFGKYPTLWGLRRPDRNIDHRRVPNLATFFSRHGESLPSSRDAADYQAGDIVTWMLPSGVPHIGLVSDRRAGERPLVVHNIGAGAQVEDVLFAYRITGHFRYLPEPVTAR